jgi:signal transduction histidine kinase
MTPGSSAGTTKDPRTRVNVGEVPTLRPLLDRLRALPAARADALLAAVLLAEAVFEVGVLSELQGADRAIAYVAVVIQAGGLAVRRRWPVVSLVAVYSFAPVLQSLGPALADHTAGPFFWIVIAGYSWGAQTHGARLWAGAAFASLASVLGVAIDAYPDTVSNYVSTISLAAAGPMLFGQALRNRGRLNRALHAKADRAAKERADAAEAAALEERTRIAGDLHDVVAHALSAMTVQAAAARRMAERDPARAEASFAVVETTGREALTELRRLLGVLRREDEELALAPQPSLAHIRSLVQRAAASGLPVELRIDGEPVLLPAGVDLTAYRLIQEALRRAREGGHAHRASVHVSYEPAEVHLEVVDDGAAEGRRLLGLRERVAVYGGELKAAAPADGGWRVTARLPVGASA